MSGQSADRPSTSRRAKPAGRKSAPSRETATPPSPSPFAINEGAAAAFDELVSLLRGHWDAYNQDGKLGIKVASYRRAAAALRQFPAPVDDHWRAGRLREIPGVGEAIAKKLDEYLQRGSFKLLDELRALGRETESPT